MLFTKRIETVWSSDISSIKGIRTFGTISSFHVSNYSDIPNINSSLIFFKCLAFFKNYYHYQDCHYYYHY